MRIQEGQPQYRQEHQQAAGLGENEELEGCIDAVFMAVYTDQEIHRDQHDLPEEVEQEKIKGCEYPDDAGQDPEEVEIVKTGAFLNFIPGRQHRQYPDKQG